jgi:hypothetical protein
MAMAMAMALAMVWTLAMAMAMAMAMALAIAMAVGMGKINSKAKGGRGEREFAQWLRENLKVSARRGCQFSGSPDSPDVVCDLGIHFEVKRTNRINIYDAISQAETDAKKTKPAIVAHRRDRGEWLLIMKANDILKIAEIVLRDLSNNPEVVS